jgi:hypothetical protein
VLVGAGEKWCISFMALWLILKRLEELNYRFLTCLDLPASWRFAIFLEFAPPSGCRRNFYI